MHVSSGPTRVVALGRWGLCLALLLNLSAAQGQPGAASTPAPTAGVHFPVSCDPAVQNRFDHAVELLHSFEYPDAEAAFRSVLKSDPSCAMARWGTAMTQWHQIWELPDESALQLGAAMLEGANGSGLTQREAGFIDALQLFFANADTRPHPARAAAYSHAMQDLYHDNRTDPEVVAFYALSLLATLDPADKSYCAQYKAAGLLNWLLSRNPHHPGGLHYLIHSYDYPGLAYLALGAAETYADVAPDSAHAQHMPSHIFTRLGLWDRSIASNRHSTASAEAYTQRAHLPGHYDEGIHSTDYLIYAYLQVADDDNAKDVLDRLRKMGRAHPENFKVAYAYAASPARYALERREWSEASRLQLTSNSFPWSRFPWALSIHHFARGIGAARSSDISGAKRELQAIENIQHDLPPETLKYWREQVFVHGDAVASWIELAEGDTDAALELAQAAAQREDAVDKHPVTPGEVLPARELLADMLLELGRSDEARSQYQTVLEHSPNRLNALLGAAEASVRSGDGANAADYYRAAIQQTARGNPHRPRLEKASAYLRHLLKAPEQN